jgi:hypothetical protein
MSNTAVEHQVQIALRENQNAEKFAEHIAELAAQIVNATFKFAEDVKSSYEAIPKRRGGDRNFDETDHAKLSLGAFNFFMHVLDRYFIRIDIQIMRDTVFDFIFGDVVKQVYAKSFPGPLAQTEKFVLNHYDSRMCELAALPTIFGESPEDSNSVMHRAARAICREDLGRDDSRLDVIVGTCLMQGLKTLALEERVAAMAETLCPPSDLRKTG